MGRLPRVYKWDTKNIVPDDGFRELNTINQTHYQRPEKHWAVEWPTPKMINNVGEMPIVERDVGGPRTGFGAVLPWYDKGHDQTYFTTSN